MEQLWTFIRTFGVLVRNLRREDLLYARFAGEGTNKQRSLMMDFIPFTLFILCIGLFCTVLIQGMLEADEPPFRQYEF